MSEEANEVLEEALLPEQSDDYFEFDGQKIQLKLLTVKHQLAFNKLVAPVMQNIALEMAINGDKAFNEMTAKDYVYLIGSLLANSDALPKLIQILCQNSGVNVTDEQMDNSTMQLEEMQTVVARYFAKKGEVENEVSNFFLNVVPVVKKGAVDLLRGINTQVLEETSTLTAS